MTTASPDIVITCNVNYCMRCICTGTEHGTCVDGQSNAGLQRICGIGQAADNMAVPEDDVQLSAMSLLQR